MNKRLTISFAVFCLAIVAVSWYALNQRSKVIHTNSVAAVTNLNGQRQEEVPSDVQPNLSLAESSRLVLDDYHAAHLAMADKVAIMNNLHDATKFTETTEYAMGGDCGVSDNATFYERLSDQRRVQIVNGSVPILRTPNLKGWNTDQAMNFMNDETVICGVGFFYPFEVRPDYILWHRACSSGMIPTNPDGTMYDDVKQCFQMEELIGEQNPQIN